MLHAETLEPGTFVLLKRIQALPFMADTRLVGGTALALLLGHRKSVDLDFFGSWEPKDQLQSTRKDFVDLYFLLHHFSISEILDFFSKKYPNTALFMAIRSLVYFADAEETPVPDMLVSFDWDKAVATIRKKVTAFAGQV